MTIEPSIRLSRRNLIVGDHVVLEGVPENVTCFASGLEGVFLGVSLNEASSRHVVSIGKLRNLRLLACFRFKMWWMMQKMGSNGRDVPLETQFLLLEIPIGGEKTVYSAVLPLVECSFRASFHGNSEDSLELCIESGDDGTKSAQFDHLVFVGAPNCDPFAAISKAVETVKRHINTFRQRAEKQVPPIADYFGWCTWDAFYKDVNQEGVEEGLRTLTSGGTPPKFVIIDDGWQTTATDQAGPEEKPKLLRLTGIKENSKFQTKAGTNVHAEGIKNIVNIAKEKYKLKYVYVWHAIIGYWGGLRPGVEAMKAYRSAMQYPNISPGVVEHEPILKTDDLTIEGIGLVDPKKAYQFFDEMHSYLAAAGVDGVKVDVQCILETLGGGFGGRVELTKQYHKALDASMAKNFSDNNIIACMSHGTDTLYCSKQTAIVRASDDFYPRDPITHTIHIASVAYNSLFLGEFMVPDWDMFHSIHPAADYHASARAISGGPIYVSDAPGKHDFELLKKLVLPDGSILRARLPGRPTVDCLFTDPTCDGVSLLKIWNMNKYTGVIGVFNCQGAAWSATTKKNTYHDTSSEPLTCSLKGKDVHLISEAATDVDWSGDCAFYAHESRELVVLPCEASTSVSLKILEHHIYTVSPIKAFAQGVEFAPIGLVGMYNGGGAIEELSYKLAITNSVTQSSQNGSNTNTNTNGTSSLEKISDTVVVHIEVKGCGEFGAYLSIRPTKCSVDSTKVDFHHDFSSGLLILNLERMPKGDKNVHVVEIEL